MTTSSNYERLAEQKLEIETKIKEYNEMLIEEGNVGMDGKLVDSEGYPRADIDLYKVRTARQQIICLSNDYKTVLSQLEDEIAAVHAKSREVASSNGGATATATRPPFARITQVDAGSPAHEAGLCVGDEIAQFGPLTHTSVSKNLAEIATHVKSHVNKIILLNVIRAENQQNVSVKIKLTPKPWSGHGVLGCRIVPID